MPFDPPDLDTRTFRELVDEARARIPRFTPDWTNLNDSDPGMTLVKLNAWLTETVLYEMNRVPDLTYTKFLELLNVRSRPAQAARTELTFRLKKLDNPTDRLRVLIPQGTKATVDDPDLEQEVLFETDRRLEAVNAALAVVIAPLGPEAEQAAEIVTEYDASAADVVWTHPARLAVDGRGPAYLGLVLRPFIKGALDSYSQDAFPEGSLDLFVETVERGRDAPEGPATQSCLFPWEVAERAEALIWEVYVGAEPGVDFAPGDPALDAWAELPVSDDTAGLTRRGHLTVEIPRRLSRATLGNLSRGFWRRLGLSKPPQTEDEFFDDLNDDDLDLYGALTAHDGTGEDILERMGLAAAADREDLLGCCVSGAEAAVHLRNILDAADPPLVLDPSAVAAVDWVDLEAGYDAAPTPVHGGSERPLYWLRARPAAGLSTAEIARISLNTVPATQGETRLDERLGASTGRPDQSYTLSKTPLLIPDPQSMIPDAEIEVGGEIWEHRFDFFDTTSASRVYTLNPATGAIRFGDGRRGQIPVAGAAVRAVRYRWGGGAVGNAAAGTVTKIKGALRDVETCENRVPAENGEDAELRADTLLRAPYDLRTRDRAVSAEDFAHLAAETPGVPVHRAFALARRRPQNGGYAEQDGAVTVVVLPKSGDPRPVPSAAQMAAICAHLEPRRLITTELYIAPPSYAEIAVLTARLRADRAVKLTELEQAARAALAAYFHPLTGGEDGEGWPFGAPIADGALYCRLLSLPGVLRVENLSLALVVDPPATDGPEDVTPLPEGHLPYLPPEAIDLRADHG